MLKSKISMFAEINYIVESSVKEAKEALVDIEGKHEFNNCNFENDKWIFYDPILNKFLNFYYYDYDLTGFEKFIDYDSDNLKTYLKCWAAANIQIYSAAYFSILSNYIGSFFNDICKEIEKKGEIDIDGLENILEIYSEYRKYQVIIGILNFSDYMDRYFSNEFLLMISRVKETLSYETNTREIPSTDFILYFHKKIMGIDYEALNDKELVLFLPVKIWWELSNFIPIRPTELTNLTNKSLKRKSDGRKYIEIERIKSRRNIKKKSITKILIKDELFNLFKLYIRKARIYGKSSTIFSYRASMIRNIKPRRNADNFVREDLVKLIDYFFNKNFSKEERELFKSDIELFTPIITRHLAFINLKRQGFHPFEIARLGGHEDLRAQEHYFNHVKNLVDVEMLNIFNEISLNKNLKEESIEIDKIESKLVNKIDWDIENNKQPNKNIKLEIGYCTDEEMNCPVSSCFDCKNWRITIDEIQKNQKLIQQKVIEKRSSIETVLYEMGKLYSLIYKNLDDDYERLSTINDKKLKLSAHKLDMLVKQYINLSNNFIKEAQDEVKGKKKN
ncbi:hypothetical protein U1P98_09835 [Lysinibacillus irui]|uniref:Tyr recombinase domain-containing protein n=1 Tax=Lysinibacillus irui TaxID=2998077 RepID=A0ABU5NKP0_9BACI|nr:hypothetical protein [Lysinibacillus irui]MEA0554876.1 hypothetical protein [Lysinibacillus irui]MEA0976591.1 hypothetical protein [Lysinibacillus irui]MEA1042745.1 hypothetical protein [Lysinibacillus irui]